MPIANYIYTLTDPLTNEIYYIGKTENVEKCYSQHCSNPRRAAKGNVYLTRWLLSLTDLGMKPIITVIDTVPDIYGGPGPRDEGSFRKKRLVEVYWAKGHPLLNHINKPKTRDARTRIDAGKRRRAQVEGSRWWQEQMKPAGYKIFIG